MKDVSPKQLARRLGTVSSPRAPADLAERLQRQIPGEFRAPLEASETRSWLGSLGIKTWATAAGAVALAAVLVVILYRPSQAYAAMLRQVAAATDRVGAVHLVLEGLYRQGEDFSFVNLNGKPQQLEIWIEQSTGDERAGRMRVDKADRVYSFDGHEAIFYDRRGNQALRKARGFVDGRLMWPAAWVREILAAEEQDTEVISLDTSGPICQLVLRRSGAEMNGKAPSFFADFERRIEIEWDRHTKRLAGLRRYVLDDGEWVLFSKVIAIEYEERFDDEVFAVELPDDVRWIGLEKGPDGVDELGPKEVAQRFWQAAKDGDWTTLKLFCPSPAMIDWLQENRPVQILELGEPYRAGNYPGVFVPYRVKFRKGDQEWVKQHDLALRKDNEYGRYVYDGGI